MIRQFKGSYRFLSNFYSSPIKIDGFRYPTVEHYYQSMKTFNPLTGEFNIGRHYSIRHAKTPAIANRYGRQCGEPHNWENNKLVYMEKGLRAKFKIVKLRKMLKKTGKKTLQEGNKWGDTFWGVDLRTGRGNNHLGVLLMKIRDEL